jgi:hypothetical protein
VKTGAISSAVMIEEVKILTQKVYGLKLFDAKRFPARYSILPKWQSRIVISIIRKTGNGMILIPTFGKRKGLAFWANPLLSGYV